MAETETKTSQIEFTGSLDVVLAARLDEPEQGAAAYAIFAHCFTCSKDIMAAHRISRALAAQGIAVLRFDFTGLGHSDGEFANTTFTSNIGDIVAAASWLRAERSAPSMLVGHSLGGAAVLAATSAIPEVTAVATIGAPSSPEHVTHLFGDVQEELEATGRAEISVGGRPFTIGRQFVEDLNAQAPEEAISTLGRALMVFHAPRDQIVGIEHAARIFTKAKHPKSFVSLDTADHLLSRREDSEFTASVLAAWAARYIAG